MMIENIKHLEKSKCFFRAQKGGADVYLGMGVNRFWVVGVLIAGIFYLFVYKKFKQRVQKQKVGDPTS
nr:MAG TPA: FeoB-associated Cys-rich membrane protein [Caudoviricetes sp.]